MSAVAAPMTVPTMEDATYGEDFKIEQHAKVYLTWDIEKRRWYVDSVTMDGYPLDGLPGGPETSYGGRHTESPEEATALEEAAETHLPTGRELAALMVEAIR